MQLLDEIVVFHHGEKRSVQLFAGDVTEIPKHEEVDVLVVSAFPGVYATRSESVIGALKSRGLSVADLAQNKSVDLREFSSCWLSREIGDPQFNFRRILCFEPLVRGRAPEVVGDIFRSLVPFTESGAGISRLAMPIVASGFQEEPILAMLESIVQAAVHWLSRGLALECIKIVAFESYDTALKGDYLAAFERAKRSAIPEVDDAIEVPTFRYDVFISYAHDNRDEVEILVEELFARRPKLRVFLDRLALKPGMAWQEHLFDALDDCAKVVSVLSPQYLTSKVCKEEFNIALLRHRESTEPVLLPFYLYSANLPSYMRLVQHVDGREGERGRIAEGAHAILDRL